MKMRLSTKLFAISIAVSIIAILAVVIYRIKSNQEFYRQSPKQEEIYREKTIQIEYNKTFDNGENE